MICFHRNKQDEEILLAYCAGTLDAGRAGSVERHAAECDECRALIAAQSEVWQALEQWTPPEVPADFDERLYDGIARQNAQPAWRIWLRELSAGGSLPWISWKPLAAGGAAVAVLAAGLLLYTPLHTPKAPDSSQQVRPETVDVEQVEVTLQDLEMLTPLAAPAGKM